MADQLSRSPALSRASSKSCMSWFRTRSLDSLSQLTEKHSDQKISLPDSKSSSSASSNMKYSIASMSSYSPPPPSRQRMKGQKDKLLRIKESGAKSSTNSNAGDVARTDDSATLMEASNLSSSGIRSNLMNSETADEIEEDWEFFPSEEQYLLKKTTTPVPPPPGEIPRNISFTSPDRLKKVSGGLVRPASTSQMEGGTSSNDDAMSVSDISPPPRATRRKESKDVFTTIPSYEASLSMHRIVDGSNWLGTHEVCAVSTQANMNIENESQGLGDEAKYGKDCKEIEDIAPNLESQLSPAARKLIASEPVPGVAKVSPESDCGSTKGATNSMDEDALKKLALPPDGAMGKEFHRSKPSDSSLGTSTADPRPPSDEVLRDSLSESSATGSTSSSNDDTESTSDDEEEDAEEEDDDVDSTSVVPSPRFSTDKDHRTEIEKDDILDEDVLCGPKNKDSDHPGNVEFRRLIKLHMPTYQAFGAQHGKKTKLRNKILYSELFGGRSRFISVNDDGTLYLLTEGKARNKVSQALREKGKKKAKNP